MGKETMAVFSNYGSDLVDVVAPGVDVLSTDTGSTYSTHNGTSFSAPVVSGIAALIWTYYPEISAQEMVQILIDSSIENRPRKVYAPNLEDDDRDKVKFKEIAKGGVANAYLAIKMIQDKAAVEYV
jgi:subtilisin family serine protease